MCCYNVDCCSSRVLLLKEHAIKSIDEISMPSSTTPLYPTIEKYDNDFIFQPQLEKYLQHIKNFINSIAMNPNKTQYHNQQHLNERIDYTFDYDFHNRIHRNLSDGNVINATAIMNVMDNNNKGDDNKQHHHQTNIVKESDDTEKNDSLSSIVQRPVSVIRKSNVDNTNLHLYTYNDVYYTIMKDVLSFACTGHFLTDFCLNQGRCFRYPVGNQSFFSCECADGYVGERCESKSVRGELFLVAPFPYALYHHYI